MAGSASDRWRIALDAFVAEMKRLYGPRVQQVILYGSRARGNAEDDSDIDTLVVLDPREDFWADLTSRHHGPTTRCSIGPKHCCYSGT